MHVQQAAPVAATEKSSLRPAWWVRLLASVPFPILYWVGDFLAWLAMSVFPYRQHVVRDNLSKCFPDFDDARVRSIMKAYYRGFSQVLMEIVKSAGLSADEFRRRVTIVDAEPARELLAKGSPVLLVAAHQCNWEWMLLALALELGYPVDAAYKPLVNAWAEREMLALRTRFGARLIPAKSLLADLIKQRKAVRAIAMVADQEPTTSEHKHWTRFLNRETAFYMGAEEIARVTRFPAFFVGMRRTSRGHYEMKLSPLAPGGQPLPHGELTERYARLTEAQILAGIPDWPWSHRRWRLKKSLYGAS